MIYVCILVALLIGFLLGHGYAVWSRTRFIHSLMPATSEHTDFDECDEYPVARRRVRRGVRVRPVHEEGIVR